MHALVNGMKKDILSCEVSGHICAFNLHQGSLEDILMQCCYLFCGYCGGFPLPLCTVVTGVGIFVKYHHAHNMESN